MRYSFKALLKDLRGIPKKQFKLFLQEAPFALIAEHTLNSRQVDTEIRSAIDSTRPFFVMRPGGTELMIVEHYLRKRLSRPTGLGTMMYAALRIRQRERDDDADYGAQLATGEVLSGISPRTSTNHDEFSAEYLRCIGNADLLSLYHWTAWSASLGISQNTPNVRFEDFDPLERHWYSGVSWLSALQGRKVLVVSPFANSIEQQYARRESISVLSQVLPDFSLMTLRPPVTFAGKASRSAWFKELEATKRRLDKLDFDVALTSAGAYGAPIAEHAKQLGKVGIHYGGSLQLLFGIWGRRWAEESYHFLNGLGVLENWVRPSPEEQPTGAERVEGGAYW